MQWPHAFPNYNVYHLPRIFSFHNSILLKNKQGPAKGMLGHEHAASAPALHCIHYECPI